MDLHTNHEMMAQSSMFIKIAVRSFSPYQGFDYTANQSYLNFSVQQNHLEGLLKCSFWFSRSRVGSDNLHF